MPLLVGSLVFYVLDHILALQPCPIPLYLQHKYDVQNIQCKAANQERKQAHHALNAYCATSATLPTLSGGDQKP